MVDGSTLLLAGLQLVDGEVHAVKTLSGTGLWVRM